MKQIIEAFGTIFSLMLGLFTSVCVITVSGQVAAAKEYKADVIAEIENSDFNPNIIASCVTQASMEGYVLQVNACTYDADNNISTAEVILEYSYTMPLFGISDVKTTRGMAR